MTLFDGFLTLYQEGKDDDANDDDGKPAASGSKDEALKLDDRAA